MKPKVLMVMALILSPACATPTSRPAEQSVRIQLERAYEKNKAALVAKDVQAIMALRTKDFHSITPDGLRHDRAAMEGYSRNFLAGVERWISLSFDIDTIALRGREVDATVRQHAVRMQLRGDNKVHHVETWVTQRETWRHTSEGWKLAKVDQVRDQRRLVDGKPG